MNAGGPSGQRTRVGIVDDQPLIRAGSRMVVESQPDFEFFGEAGDGHKAIALTRETAPHVLLLDIRMPGLDGIRALDGILSASPDTRVIMLTTFDVGGDVYAALRAGFSGFLLKDIAPEQLVAGVRTVAAGDMLLAPALTVGSVR